MVTQFQKKFKFFLLILALFVCLLPLNSASGQTYRFTLPTYEVEAYLEADGSLTLYYYMEFANDPNASPIDFIDLGLPYADYSLNSIEATINDQKMPSVANSAYVNGAELGLKNLAIQPGSTGIVIVWVRNIKGVLFAYDQPDHQNYLNFQFTPNTFGSEFDRSTATKYRMTIVLPPGVDVNQGVYYEPSGWPGSKTPEASTTKDGRVYYSWYTENADVHTTYMFGSAFPASAVPAGIVATKQVVVNPPSGSGGTSGGLSSFLSSLPCCGFLVVFGIFSFFVISSALKNNKDRKMQYMSPKISIEGQGIKRGLTAVEAGILMEEPLDKVLTMILFGLLKKNAVTVVQKDPLKLEPSTPLPEGLHAYETGFLDAFKLEDKTDRKRALQSMIIDLVKSLTEKMKGFSKKETVDYYKDIMNRAWNAVETAQTPEVKSAQFNETLEWTMLDKEFNDKTERTFSGGPVFVPVWWPRYDPMYRPAYGGGGSLGTPATVSTAPGGGSGGSTTSLNLPHIPGSDFAASVINGTSTLAAGVVGDVTGFTQGVTNKTNPIPVSTPSSGGGGFRGGGGGGHSCACACACAGCACACAGGGR